MLDRVRTLLALERNYLAVERTLYAELRTGITLALIGPPASAVVAYIIPYIPSEGTILLFLFLTIITVLGIWIIYNSRSKLGDVRMKITKLQERVVMIMDKSEEVKALLEDLISS